jgi:hypothetical protein
VYLSVVTVTRLHEQTDPVLVCDARDELPVTACKIPDHRHLIGAGAAGLETNLATLHVAILHAMI